MKRKLLSIILVIAMLLPASAVVHAEDGDITVLFTNDVHCAIDNYAILAAYRSELVSQGKEVFTVDAGDAIQGETIGTFTNGEAVVELMNSVGYDYAVPGNHEFDYGMESFLNIAQNLANYKYISSNFQYLPSASAVFEPYAVEEVNGVSIAFVGISTPETITKANPKYFKDENNNFIYGFPTFDMADGILYQNVQKSVDAAKEEGADIVIAIGHLGIAETTEGWKSVDVIANTNGIDCFLDAHSHETIESSTYYNKDGEEVVLASTGTKFANIGVLTIDSEGSLTVDLMATDSVDVSALSADAQNAYSGVKSKIDRYNDEIAYLFDPIGTSEVNLVAYDTDSTWLVRKRETNAGDFVADAYRAVTGADIAVCNGGGIRSEIAVGEVSRKSLIDMNPWSNPMCVIEISGGQLLDMLEHGARSCPESLGGFFQVSGVKYSIDTRNESPVITNSYGDFVSVDETKKRRVSDVCVNGEALDPNKKYTVAGSKYVLMEGGDGLTMLDGVAVIQDEGLPCDSEMLIKYFTETLGGVIPASAYGNLKGDGRITIIKDNVIIDGETIDGVTSFTSSVTFDEKADVNFKFIPEKTGTYLFKSVSKGDEDPYCHVSDSENNTLYQIDDYAENYDFVGIFSLSEGTEYYFEIGVYSGQGEIEISMNLLEKDVGDANGDGVVNNLDASLVLKYDAAIEELDDTQMLYANVNFDGKVNNVDASSILKYDAGLLDSFFEN